tara:strand:+ start:331 stop:489 length:159 start_codon:yes stop_codon:yes gene_type:complete
MDTWDDNENVKDVVDAMFDAGHKKIERLGIKTSGDDRMAKIEANIILWLRNS